MLNDRDKYLIYSELAKLSEAGFPINNAAEAILDTRPPSRQANFLKEIINGKQDLMLKFKELLIRNLHGLKKILGGKEN